MIGGFTTLVICYVLYDDSLDKGNALIRTLKLLVSRKLVRA